MDKNIENQDNLLNTCDSQLPAERTRTSRGAQEIDKEDKMIPRLKLMQTNSPEVEIGAAKAGDFVNSLSGMTYGDRIMFVPIVWWKSRIYWAPRDEGGMLCNARDGMNGSNFGICMECMNKDWNKDSDEPPKCTAIFNILASVGNELVALTFCNSNYKTGKQLINLFAYKKYDIFNFQYELYSFKTSNDKGKFYIQKFKDANIVTPDALYKSCEKLYNDFGNFVAEKVEEVPEKTA